MKKYFYLLIIPLFFACEKESQRGGGLQLTQIKSANRISQTFEYDGQRLTKVNFYGLCTMPSDEVSYFYQNNRLERVETTMRSLYSSSAANCNPALGVKSEESFVYDGAGRVVRTNRSNSYSLYSYSPQGRIVSETNYDQNGNPVATTTYKYDSRGNLVEQSGPSVFMQFEYDDKVNPMHLMKQKPSYISAFTTSPNNVIKGTTGFGGTWQRIILEYRNDMPVRVSENGVEYEYIYQ